MRDIKNEDQIQIELTDDIAQGIYSNLTLLTHSSSEFVLDFIRIVPGVPKSKVKSRVILSPEHAKRLMYALKDNLVQYEKKHGSVNLDNNVGEFTRSITDD